MVEKLVEVEGRGRIPNERMRVRGKVRPRAKARATIGNCWEEANEILGKLEKLGKLGKFGKLLRPIYDRSLQW